MILSTIIIHYHNDFPSSFPWQDRSIEYIDIVSTTVADVQGSVYQGIDYSPHLNCCNNEGKGWADIMKPNYWLNFALKSSVENQKSIINIQRCSI